MKIEAKFFVVMVVILALFWFTLASGAAEASEVRGQVTNLGVNQFTWTNANFPGFYYDIDKNLGAETLHSHYQTPLQLVLRSATSRSIM
jgi:hypothetical protein